MKQPKSPLQNNLVVGFLLGSLSTFLIMGLLRIMFDHVDALHAAITYKPTPMPSVSMEIGPIQAEPMPITPETTEPLKTIRPEITELIEYAKQASESANKVEMMAMDEYNQSFDRQMHMNRGKPYFYWHAGRSDLDMTGDFLGKYLETKKCAWIIETIRASEIISKYKVTPRTVEEIEKC